MTHPESFEKTLSRPEARHRYWHIKKEDREFSGIAPVLHSKV